MKRRNFLGGIAALPVVAAMPLSGKSEDAVKSSVWLEVLDQKIDPRSVLTVHGRPIKSIDLNGAMVSICQLDQTFAELSERKTVELFPKSIWKGCYILSVGFHLSSYMAMRYELTADKDNAELNRAHEGAQWVIDDRIPRDTVLLESANGNLAILRRCYCPR